MRTHSWERRIVQVIATLLGILAVTLLMVVLLAVMGNLQLQGL